MSQPSAKDRIVRERVQLLVKRPFFGLLALGLELKESPEINTMATDGEYLLYNPVFVNKLTPAVLQTIVAHEILHPALGHLWRKGSRNHDKWNQAADYADNLILKDEGFEIPPYVLCDEQYRGMEAEIIYTKLPDVLPKGKRLMDSHEPWDDAKGKKSQGSSGDKQEDLARAWRERLARAAAQAQMMGKLPGTIENRIRDILEPKLDWRIILRDMITAQVRNNFRLVPPAKKHLWRGIYLPAMEGETLEIAIAIDTSGSISAKQFQAFVAEIRGVTEQFDDYTLHLFFCDAAVHDHIVLTRYDEWPGDLPKKNGGTSFVPVFAALDAEATPISVLVFLTDGDGAFPEEPPEFPVIWLLTKEKRVPFGASILMEDCDDSQ